ncbi:MAG: hypothetical protein GC171_06730 [Terrimonas sp.]|nr:hypothetical protein [Terrimonas sp.]
MNETQDNSVLAHWYYAAEEWKAFMKGEKKVRGTDILVECFFIILLGGALIHFLRGAAWSVAFLVGVAFACIYGLTKFTLRMSSLKWNIHALPQVMITKNEVIVNGKITEFHNGSKWLRRVTLHEKGGGAYHGNHI